jgi:hypothetical protein
MSEAVEIVDRGRGLQLSTSRVTVMDLVPYFRGGCSWSEIRQWIPSLTDLEISVVEKYYREHKAELDEHDKLARARREEQIKEQHRRFPEILESQEERISRLKRLLESRCRGTNGDGHPGGC